MDNFYPAVKASLNDDADDTNDERTNDENYEYYGQYYGFDVVDYDTGVDFNEDADIAFGDAN